MCTGKGLAGTPSSEAGPLLCSLEVCFTASERPWRKLDSCSSVKMVCDLGIPRVVILFSLYFDNEESNVVQKVRRESRES